MPHPSGSVLGILVDGLVIRGVSMVEGVRCECADPACGCGATCKGLACYEWGSVDDGDWEYLCHRCALRMVERGTAPARSPVEDDEREEVNE